DLLCGSGTSGKRPNKDIDFTTTLDTPLTLEVDFTQGGDASADEEDLLALAANLYGHDVPPVILGAHLSFDEESNQASTGLEYLHDLRAVIAKRSVAHNSFAGIAAQKAQGEGEVEPYLYKLLEEMGVPKKDIQTMLGERPSYYAQMEVLTKKL